MEMRQLVEWRSPLLPSLQVISRISCDSGHMTVQKELWVSLRRHAVLSAQASGKTSETLY